MSRSRRDTIRLEGVQTQTLPGGTPDSARVRFEREVWMRWLSDEARKAEMPPSRGGIVYGAVVPFDSVAFARTPLGRLQPGDTVELRELLREWAEEDGRRSPQSPQGLWWVWPRVFPSGARPLPTNLIQTAYWDVGDTVAAIAATTTRSRPESIRLALQILDDPARTLKLGIDVGQKVDQLAGAMRGNVRVRPGTEGDRAIASATAELEEALDWLQDPRLRDVAVMANLFRNPGRWYDEVTRRSQEGSLIAQVGKLMADGATRWPGSLGEGLSRGAAYLRSDGLPAPAPDAPPSEWERWYEDAGGSHVPVSIYLYGARRGWDPVQGILERYRTAATAKDKALFGHMLLTLSPDFLRPQEAAGMLLGQGPLRDLAVRWVGMAPYSTGLGQLRDVLETALKTLRTNGAPWPGTPTVPGLLDDAGQPVSVIMFPTGVWWPEWKDPIAVDGVQFTTFDESRALPDEFDGMILELYKAWKKGPIVFLEFTAQVGPVVEQGYGRSRARHGISIILVETPDGLKWMGNWGRRAARTPRPYPIGSNR